MQTLAFLPNVGWLELTVIGIILLLLFGRRLPEVGRSLGQGIVEFKKGLKDVTDDIKHEVDKSDSASAQTAPQAPAQAAQFDSARPPKNPDMLDSAHTSSTQVSEHASADEPHREG